MEVTERRNEIMKKLCRRRSDTIANLATELGVSERTVRRDIERLSASYPIYTQSGRAGGIFVVGTYSMDRMYMMPEEIDLLRKLEGAAARDGLLSPTETSLLHNLILQYTKPTGKEGRT